MTRRIISMIVLLMIIITVNTIFPLSITAITSGDYEFSILEDGTAEISRYSGYASDISIPNTIGDYTVTSIGSMAFLNKSTITSLNIPATVTNIGDYAFKGCSKLASIGICDSVMTVGLGAFYDTAWYWKQPLGLIYIGKAAYVMKGTCPSEIVIKEGTVSISKSAFWNCKELESISIPDTVINIGSEAFQYCSGLSSVNVPDSVTSLGHHAFELCSGLTDVNLPNSITTIKEGLFRLCTGLTSIVIPDSVSSIERNAFLYCDSLASINIPDSVTHIGYEAFYGCTELNSITIPETVLKIDDYALGYYSDSGTKKKEDFTIYGYNGSAAEAYAADNGFTFIALDEEPELLGDVDDDGEVGVIDATVIQRYAAGFNVAYSEAEMLRRGDVDGDEEAGVLDATYIQRYDAGFNVPYPIGEAIA